MERSFAVRVGDWYPVASTSSKTAGAGGGGAALAVLPLGLGLSVGAASSGTGQDAQSVPHGHDPTATLGFGTWGSCFGGEMGIEKLLDQPQHHLLPGEVLAGRVLCSTRMGVISVSCALNLPLKAPP